MAETKTVLPKPRIRIDEFGDITPITGNSRFVTGDFYDADQMREAIEAAVLSANAGKVDADDTLKVIVAELINGYRCEDSEGRQVFRMPADFTTRIAKLNRPTQQAIDAGKV